VQVKSAVRIGCPGCERFGTVGTRSNEKGDWGSCLEVYGCIRSKTKKTVCRSASLFTVAGKQDLQQRVSDQASLAPSACSSGSTDHKQTLTRSVAQGFLAVFQS